MIAKRMVLTEHARRDVRQITAWYRKEGGMALARRWVATREDALRYVEAHPQTRATRCAVQLKLDDLRFWSVSGFPYLVLYVERQQHVDVGRVLHGERDIPAWLGERQ